MKFRKKTGGKVKKVGTRQGCYVPLTRDFPLAPTAPPKVSATAISRGEGGETIPLASVAAEAINECSNAHEPSRHEGGGGGVNYCFFESNESGREKGQSDSQSVLSCGADGVWRSLVAVLGKFPYSLPF